MSKLLSFFRLIIYERNFLSLAGNVSYAFFGLLSFLLLTRSLPQYEFGLYMIFITTSTFVDLFRFGLTRNALIRFLSGSEGSIRLSYLGANVFLGVVLVAIISLLLIIAVLLFPLQIGNSDFRYFFYFYPLLAFANLFWNNAISVLQSWQAFGRILLLRTVNIVSFVLFLVVNFFWGHFGLVIIIWAFIFSNLLSSFLSFLLNWDGSFYLLKTKKKEVLDIFHYGKFAVGTLVGSSLLRSADTFLLGLAPFFGANGVALYTIPLKMTELLEIPLRSFMATAFPKLSKFNLQTHAAEWKTVFYSYGGAITFLFVPFTLFLFIFAKPIVLFLGGNQYLDSIHELTLIFQIFTLYGLILPLDRISGVALDSINLPNKNLIKVVFMAAANILGDLIAIYYFQSLFWVAFATVFNTIVGLFLGYYFLSKAVKIEFKSFYVFGFDFFKGLYNNVLSKFR